MELKDSIKTATEIFFKPGRYGPGVAKDCCELIAKAFEQPQSGKIIAEGMLELEKKYPGIGFKEEAERLMKELHNGNGRNFDGK